MIDCESNGFLGEASPVACFALCSVLFSPASLLAEQPNIVLIVADDLGEEHNLAGSMPEKTQQLADRLHAQLQQYDAIPLEPNPNYDPDNPLKGAYWGQWVP